MSQKRMKSVRRAANKVAQKQIKEMHFTAHDLLNAVKETWTRTERLQLALWLLFGRGRWGGTGPSKAEKEQGVV